LSSKKLILEGEFRSLQVDNGVEANATTAIFTIINPNPEIAHFLQDVQDDTVLSGFSSLGGLWTIINGIFALLFGAEIAYFAFRMSLPLSGLNAADYVVDRRSLSALGLVHWFDQKELTRKWKEDFPALRTEGGQPGSDHAGIVAFIRERMVDVDDDDEDEPAGMRKTGNARDVKPATSEESGILLVAMQPATPVDSEEDKSVEDKASEGQSASEARREGEVSV
jgi:hypothetical protein